MTGDDPLRWLGAAATQRKDAGLHRVLRPRGVQSDLLDLASNDYLGLSHDPRVIEAATAAVRRWGTGSTGSRLVTGSTELHAELENALAELVGAPDALVFSSGFLANLAAVTAMSGPDCLIVSDAGNHASLVDGCRLAKAAGAEVRVTPHGDLAAAEEALTASTRSRALLVIDAINSANGDLLALADWHAMARRHGAMLIVDDAHGIGVRGSGRGAVAEAGLAAEPDVVTTITLSKSLGAQGGAVLGATAAIEHLIDTARSFIFDTALNPAAAGAALQASRIVTAEPQLAKSVLSRAAEIADIARVASTDSAVVPVIIGAASDAYDTAMALRDRGILVGCFRPPSVPPGTARLRITARATLTDADLDRFRQSLTAVLPR
ncbi:MAG TPA: 8-amino-7-oxononanoate synthase [Jatrophihabitans sp.]